MDACSRYESEIYIPFESVKINWKWTRSDVKKFRKYFKFGYGIKNTRFLSRLFNRTGEEVLLMLIDCALSDNIARDASPLGETYIALESVNIDWFWWGSEVDKVDRLVGKGMDYQEIAAELGRDEAEVLILILDRVLQGKFSEIILLRGWEDVC